MKHEICLQTRREFLQTSLGLMAAAWTVPSFLSQTVRAAVTGEGKSDRVLVIIQLSGGNDGLNTVIPFVDDRYYQARPTLAIPAKDVVRLTDSVGLHPSLAPLGKVYENGQLAVVQGVGYPNPDRSHFRSMEIWQTARPEEFVANGWIGRLFDHTCSNGHLKASPTLAASIDSTLNPSLNGSSGVGVALQDAERFYQLTRFASKSAADDKAVSGNAQLDFLRRTALNAQVAAEEIRSAARKQGNGVAYPQEPFGQQLALVARMIAGGMDTRVYYLSLGSFDTHANQAGSQSRLLESLGKGIAAFTDDCRKLGIGDRVVGFTFSEFGRRVKENGSGGTDHGQAAPMFVFGQPVKPGIIGEQPSLGDLNQGDLKFHTDFRQVYATMLDRWLGVDSAAVLGRTFDALPVVG